METGITIIKSSCASFNNALHAQFHRLIFGIVTSGKADPATFFVTSDLLTEWDGHICTEEDISREVTASLKTELMAAKEADRDEDITGLFAAFRAAALNPIPEIRMAGKTLSLLADKNEGLQKEPVDQETQHINGLLTDLRKPENAAAVTKLGLDAVVEKLDADNQEYQALRSERTAARAESKLPAAKVVRPLSDAILYRICQFIEVAYLVCTDPEQKAAIKALADLMNQQITESRAAHNQSMGLKYGAGSGTGTPTKPDSDYPGSTDGGTTPDTTPDSGTDTTPDSGTDTGGSDGDDDYDGGGLVG